MIMMSGIDYKLAPLSLREKFSLTGDMLENAYLKLRDMPLSGAVIVSTCNRTELYMVADKTLDPFEVLCLITGTDGADHYSLFGSDVMRHLCELASGAKSQIWGEDQIITQVKDSLLTAREHNLSGSVLEVMFRDAVAAAKQIKTEIKFTGENSVVYKALNILRGFDDIKKVMVIGNGEIGRLMTAALVENGYHTTMTLRSYRHGETIVPAGAHTADYTGRYEKLTECGAVISATRSPHHTVDRIKLDTRYPKLWIDLAVPRDIDPGIQDLPGVTYYDIDSLCGNDIRRGQDEKLVEAEPIIEKHVANFERWLSYRRTLENEKKEYFPLFISSKGKKALIAGGGRIAARRVNTLLRFEFEVIVVAPEISEEIEKMKDMLTLIRREFIDSDLDGCFIAIAATGNREVNRRIGLAAAERGIFASVADRRDECGFLFPAIVLNDDIVAGVTSGGKSHHAVKEAARRFREVLQ